MGSSFELGIVGESDNLSEKLLNEGVDEIKRLENLLSEFKEDSIISQINKNAGKSAIEVDEEVFDLLRRCLMISRISQGYFDISVSPLKKIYQFKKEAFSLPDKTKINKTLNSIGYNKIVLDENNKTVFLQKMGMHISLAAIGKGFAADKVKKLWITQKVESGYINASGDLTAFGNNLLGNPWEIAIANPDDRQKNLFMVPLLNKSVATSGDYEQHFWHRGKKYSHNINPKTGLPLTGIKSVSVFSMSAELSDALATAVYSMGIIAGMEFIEKIPNTHAIWIDDNNKVFFSKNLGYASVY